MRLVDGNTDYQMGLLSKTKVVTNGVGMSHTREERPMKLKSRRCFMLSVLVTVLFLFNAVPAFAAEQAIPSIQIDAVLQRDGSAAITENWDVRGVSGGTEYYKALNNMDGMSVHSLMVKDESGTQYKTLDSWNPNLSREEKAGTCGILKTSNGYELCWGIGDYGDHQYTVQYVLDELVKDYGDYAGFYHQFVSKLSSAPGLVSITIQVADTVLTENNARIWGYGFPGEVKIAGNGSLKAFSSQPFDSNHKVNVLCRFDRALFPKASTADMSFEELQKSAENRSPHVALYVFLGILAAGTAGAVIFFVSRFKLADGTVVRLARRDKIEVTWSIPFGSSIPAVSAAMELLRKRISCDSLMSAYLIRWQKIGYISIEERERENKRGRLKKEEVIVFYPEKTPVNGAEQSLYHILSRYADSDGILWSSAIEKQAEKIYEKLCDWSKEVNREGQKELIRLGAAANDKNGVVRFTASGFDQAVRMLGLQKYLREMQEPKDGETTQRELWGDYLVFAALFNMGEQVLKSMKTLDPAYFETFSGMYGYNSYRMMYFMTMTHHISNSAAPNVSGTGGAAGSIGGGGFSGGGGGGSR